MKRFFALFAIIAGFTLLSAAPLASAAVKPKAVKFPVNFHALVRGDTVYFRPAGLEPDFDLVNRVIIVTHLHHHGLPPMTLILDAFLESFQSDTQPVLPDLTHPNNLLQNTLGGFFSGEAIIVDHSKKILYTGAMLAEALINPNCLLLNPNTKSPPAYCLTETQHMQVALVGQGPAAGSTLLSRSWFTGNSKLQVTSGQIYGKWHFTKKALKLLKKGPGPGVASKASAHTLSINQVLTDFNIPFPRQRGLGSSGPKGLQCFASHCITPSKLPGAAGTSSKSHGQTLGVNLPSTTSGGGIRWTMVLGFVLIGMAVVLLGVYFWQGNREKQRQRVSSSA